MVRIGSKFPEFNLESFNPKIKKEGRVSNSDLAKKWAVIFFYPADFTFVCPTELADLAKRYAEFQKLNCEVYGVSTDTIFTHKAWLETEHLLQKVEYPLLADHNGKLAKDLEIYDEESGMAGRGVYIIDPKGNLKAYQVVADNIGRSAGEILRQVRALKFVAENPGLVCPASWDSGQPTLKPKLAISGKIYTKLPQQ